VATTAGPIRGKCCRPAVATTAVARPRQTLSPHLAIATPDGADVSPDLPRCS